MKLNITATDPFIQRHIGPSDDEKKEMLQAIGAGSLDELISQTIPAAIRSEQQLNLPEAVSEYEYLYRLKKIASKNKLYRSYIGLGYYNTITPPAIQRNILENPGWYTQYTPYQAEIAQGRLEALLNFQTMVSDLTGMEIANASLLDEGTAAAEAMIMLFNYKNRKAKADDTANKFFVSDKCYPQTIDVLQSRAKGLDIELVIGNHSSFEFDEKVFGCLLQYPDMEGAAADISAFIEKAHSADVYVAVAADLLSLCLLTPPGEMGADVVVGNTQRFGVPLGYGGPHAAYFATKDEFKRNVPGRIIGVSVDSRGNRAYRMALQTREQHIKRERATSNICTAQALLAIMAGMYGIYHGPTGLKNIATRVHLLTKLLAQKLEELGYSIRHRHYFDTLCIENADMQKLKKAAGEQEVNFYFNENDVLISLDETVQPRDIEDIIKIFAKAKGEVKEIAIPSEMDESAIGLPEALMRKSGYLKHPVFNAFHSETKLMRYIKSLEKKDLSLTTSMIPLGSCTMKLNAAAELMPVSWPEFNQIHPFVPREQAEGYAQVINELEQYLCEITGFDGCSLQPNSGAQGEYAGLMVIKAYHEDRGDDQRNIVLIPSSAHGTNPASGVMAGMQVVVVKCDENGNIDVEDLKAKAAHYSDRLAALMVTYPSTHGVFEEEIREICSTIHEHGGQVYMDGANMNAQVGLTNPSIIGADVCHLNLHKTFSIPHGGGGPGMGPICTAPQLTPYLPKHPLVEMGGSKGIPAISAAPWGSASILLISYAYIRLLGSKGCTEASKYAILNANYLKSRLEKHYNILFVGKKGRVAHEMIIDFRPFKQSCGIEVEDVAKRLIDYNFHAPTVSFPVPGTMMIEPTESEAKDELDRFCEAMIAIRQEIKAIEEGAEDAKNNVLKNAPHTAEVAMADEWLFPYSREKAVFPLPYVAQNKFWVSVGRVDNAYGDRNLICTCPPLQEYEMEL